MYSLYRAWFGGPSEESSYPRLESLSPPDTLVRVGNEGEYHFVAHRSVLAAHSGYLEALLAATAAVPATAEGNSASGSPLDSAGPSSTPLVTSITVPSTIGGEAFAPLLNYMYTGRLEVTLDNIYTVLLATHLLHMPGALQQCRAALLRLRAPTTAVVPPASISPPASSSPPPVPQSQQPLPQQQQQTSTAGSILRPVPNRLLGPAFCWPRGTATAACAGHLFPPRHLELAHLPSLSLQPSISALPSSIIHKSALYGTRERSVSPASCSSQPTQQQQQQPGGSRSPLTSPELMVASSASSVTQRSDEQQQPTRGPSPSTSSEHISIGEESRSPQQPPLHHSILQRQQQQQTPRRRRPSSQQQQQKRLSQATDRSSSSSNSGQPQNAPGVVYDVACCDGPVRFHRVLNENYAPGAAAQTQAAQQQHRRTLLAHQCNGRASSEEALVVDCRENDENLHRQAQLPEVQPTPAASSNCDTSTTTITTGSSNNNNNNNNNEVRTGSSSYTCGYCQHTFKSQYCYRKHARRHLLPTDSENTAERQLLGRLSQHQQQQQQLIQPQPLPPEGKKREVRLLDLNVQYYPCKICGSKFPSYYFVHKHRKLCHANVEEPASQGRVAGPPSFLGDQLGLAKSTAQSTQQLSPQRQQPSTSETTTQQQQQQQPA